MSKQKQNHRSPSAGTILAILAFVAVMLAFPMLLSTDGGSSGESYDAYFAPVLPMTAISGGESLEVERNVDYDFAPYRDLERTALTHGAVEVTDSYWLTNRTGEPVTVQLSYPFLGAPSSDTEKIPALTQNGSPVEGVLYGSVDIQDALWGADSFREFAKLVQETDYFVQAAYRLEAPEEAVKVYHITGIVSPKGDAQLVHSFSLPEGATAWALGHMSWSQDENARQIQLTVPANQAEEYWIMVAGGDLENLSYSGGEGVEAPEFQVEVYDSTFRETMWLYAQSYDPYDPLPQGVTPEFLYWDLMQRKEMKREAVPFQVVDTYFDWAVAKGRMLYWVFDVEIPAGETVEITASFQLTASYDFGGPKKPREGYDMATRLGSDLNFTAQSASIQNGDLVNIIRQNFGFDLEKGITQVELDLNIERYYLEVAVES